MGVSMALAFASIRQDSNGTGSSGKMTPILAIAKTPSGGFWMVAVADMGGCLKSIGSLMGTFLTTIIPSMCFAGVFPVFSIVTGAQSEVLTAILRGRNLIFSHGLCPILISVS